MKRFDRNLTAARCGSWRGAAEKEWKGGAGDTAKPRLKSHEAYEPALILGPISEAVFMGYALNGAYAYVTAAFRLSSRLGLEAGFYPFSSIGRYKSSTEIPSGISLPGDTIWNIG